MLKKIGGNTLPLIVLALVAIFGLRTIIANAPLVYGDVSYSVPGITQANPIYSWGSEAFGTNVRLSPGAIRDSLILALSPNSYTYFLLSYLLPLLLLPFCYYLLIRKFKVSRWIAIIGGLASLANPIVFGDFLNGQTFWIYLTAPWAIYFTIQIFYKFETSLQNVISLVLILLASYAVLPPIIVPLAVVEAVVCLLSLILTPHMVSRKIFYRLCVASIATVLLLALLLIPYLIIVPSGAAAYTPSSLIADYYHNYAEMNLLNTLRLAGNEGNGQGALGYNGPSPFNVFGYISFATILAGIIAASYYKKEEILRVLALLAFPFIAAVGLIELMAVNSAFGLALFKSQFIVATIRNPTKLFVLLLPFYTLSFAVALNLLLQHSRKLAKISILVFVIACLAIYNWPFLRGDLGLFFNNEIANFKPSLQVAEIANDANTHQGRSIIVPSTHRDELNYQGVSKNLSALRLGGSLPQAGSLVSQMQRSLNTSDQYFFKLINILGISTIYLKTDQSFYGPHAFALFQNTLGHNLSSIFLTQGGLTKNTQGEFERYQNPKATELISSPQIIKNIDQNKPAIPEILSLYQDKIAILSGASSKIAPYYDNYTVSAQSPDSELKGKALLYDSTIIVIQYYRHEIGGKKYLSLETLDPVSLKTITKVDRPLQNDENVALLDDKRLEITDSPKRDHVRAGDHSLQIGKLVSQSGVVANNSFENDIPMAADASKGRSGKANIYSRPSNDATDGRTSVLLGSKNHLAYFWSDFKVDDPKAQYLLKINYKNLTGKSPFINVMQDNSVLGSSGQMDTGKKWSTYELGFSPLNSNHISINFYTDAGSENLFDNIQIYKLTTHFDSEQNIQKYSNDYDLDAYRNDLRPDTHAEPNIIANGSFEDSVLWGSVSDASAGSPGKAEIKADANNEAVEGNSSLKLSAKNHTAYVSRPLTNFDPNQIYSLSMYYENKSGRAPSYAIVGNDGQVLAASGLSQGKGWQHYQKTFIADPNVKSAQLYLYSPSKGEDTINLFDDVKISAQSLISNYLVQTSQAKVPLINIVSSYKRLNPTEFRVDLKQGTGLVMLNESYHQGWKAFLVEKGTESQGIMDKIFMRKPGPEISVDNHVLVNGFANGWVVENNNNADLVLEYWPQRYIYPGLLISVCTLSVCILALVFARRRQKSSRSTRP